MGMSIFKYIWFMLVLASGFVAALLGSLHYGADIDFAYWGNISNKALNKFPQMLESPMVDAYGFYGGLFFFVVFLAMFVITSRTIRGNRDGADYAYAEGNDDATEAPVSQSDDSEPDQSDDSEPDPDDYVTATADQPVETINYEAGEVDTEEDHTGDSIESESDEDLSQSWLKADQG